LSLPELENLKLQPGFQKLSYTVVSICPYVAGYGTKFHARKYQEHICRIQCVWYATVNCLLGCRGYRISTNRWQQSFRWIQYLLLCNGCDRTSLSCGV